MNQKHHPFIYLILLVAAIAFTFQNASAWQLQQPAPPQESRPRKVTEQPPEQQEDKPIKLSTNLVTVIAGVSDAEEFPSTISHRMTLNCLKIMFSRTYPIFSERGRCRCA